MASDATVSIMAIKKVNIEDLTRASGQNIKRLLEQKVRQYTPDPATALALSIGNSVFECKQSISR